MITNNRTRTSNHHAVNFPIAIGRKQIRIRPTRNGLIFMVLVAAMFVGSFNYNSNLGFLFTFFLGSIAFVSITSTCKNVLGISIGSVFAEPVFAGKKANFELTVAGGIAPRIRIGFAFADHPAVYHDLPAREDNRIRVSVLANSRGMFKPGLVSMHSDYPLGLFRVSALIDANLECVVYPQPLKGDLRTIDSESSTSEDRRISGPGSDDFQGLKNYAPGDPLQRISWRASARGQGLFTKDFTGKSGSAVFLDWHRLNSSDPERRLSRLCHMVLQAYCNDMHYGLRLPGHSLAPGKGRDHKLRCLKALALY